MKRLLQVFTLITYSLTCGFLVLAAIRYLHRPTVKIGQTINRSALQYLVINDEDKKWVEHKKPLVVAFVDFQCPYCRIQLPTLLQWEKITKGQVRLDIRHFPLSSLHPFAYPASTMFVLRSQAKEPTQVAATLCKLDLQKTMVEGNQIDDFLGGTVSQASAERARKVVDSDVVSAKALGVHGTPTFFVVRSNGEIIEANRLKDLDELCNP